MAVKYPITLSVSEPNNNIGLLKIRQADEQTQTLVVQLTETSTPKSYEGLQPFFCAKLGQSLGLGIIEQKLEVAEMTNPKDGQLEYTFRAEDWQQLGRQTAYFSFRKMTDDYTYVEQFSTRDFYYNVMKNVFSDGIKEVMKDGSTYVWTIEDIVRLFKEYMATGKIEWENYKNDERTIWETYRLAEKINWDDYKLREKNEWQNYKAEEKTTWEKFIEDNREFLENADPGGKIILELLGARNGAESLGERLDSEKAEVSTQLAHIAIDATIFGAKGDGVTDDTVAIQSAIDFLENQRVGNQGGGTVLLPDGEFKATNLLLKSNITLRGSGYSSILKLSVNPENWNSPIILGGVDRVSENVLIENMVIDGNHPTGEFVSEIQQSHGISLQQNSKNIRINNVKFRNIAGDGVWLASTDGIVFPEDIAITGCSFENIGRQDIALVHGHDIIISGNRGTGHLDIEPESPAGGVKRVSVVNNIFDAISIMNYSYQRSEFVVQGNVATAFNVWNLGGLSFVGNSCFGKLKIFNVKKAIFSDNLIKCLEISPSTTSFNEDIIISKNIIDNINNGTDDPQIVPVPASPATIYIWRTKRMKFVDNIINSPSLTAILVAFPCEDIEIRGNKFMDAVSTAGTYGVHVMSHSTSKNINVIDKEITGFFVGVYSTGASKLSGLKVKRNRIEARNKNYEINMASKVIIEGNELIGNATNYFGTVDFLIHEFNKYSNTQNATNFIDMLNCTNVKSRFNDYETVNAQLIRAYNSPSFFINERLTTTGLAIGGTTTVLQGSRYETGESTRLGTVYNGTEWVDWSF